MNDPAPDKKEAAQQDDHCSLQWVALAVLLFCWVAEAYV
jgi:hypothetical protein